MENKIVIYKSKNKAIIIILVGLLLIIGGWLWFHYEGKHVIGWSFFILSALCLLFGIGTWFDRKPHFILTEKGITELPGVRQEIEWDAICQVDEFYFRGQYFIRLLVDRNYKPELVQPTWFYRFDRFYEKEGVKAIFMRIGFLEANSIKLARFVDKMIKADPTQRRALLNTPVKNW